MDYVVRTEVFEGPFDLLLHLIARQRVDLWQVSLSRITEDYLAEIKRMHELNLDVATEFLVVAATLLELKAARLLPSPDGESDEVEALLEERDLLFARLLRYKAYELVGGGALPIEVVIHFLALLELYKRSMVEIDQEEAFGSILVRWSGGEAGDGRAAVALEELA